MNISVVFDLEFNPVSFAEKNAKEKLKNEIIEIGEVKMDKHLRGVDSFKCFIKPEYNHQINMAQQIEHLGRTS